MVMTTEQQKNVFRLAAIIYGRSAKGVSLGKSYQKVIDDALFCCGKVSISLTDLIVYIKTNYGFLYTPKEIQMWLMVVTQKKSIILFTKMMS